MSVTLVCERCDRAFEHHTRQKRRYCSENCRKRRWDAVVYRHECVDCGADVDRRNARCTSCYHIVQKKRRHELVRLWNDGWSMATLADHFSTTVNSIGTTIAVLRKEGAWLPYRHDHGEAKNYDLPVERAA